MKKFKKGAQGVGTLIIFVALILVSGIAAGVLITTGNVFQSKSLETSNLVEEKLVGGVDIVQITVEGVQDGAVNETVDTFYITVRTAIGSGPIKLEDLFATLDTETGSYFFEAFLGGLPGPNDYQITYLSNAGVAQNDGYILKGELVELAITAPQNLSEEDTIQVGLTGATITTADASITFPSAMVQNRVILYP